MQQLLRMIKGKLWQGYVSAEDEQWNLAPNLKDCIFCERQKKIKKYNRGRTHKAHGSLLEWKDKLRGLNDFVGGEV